MNRRSRLTVWLATFSALIALEVSGMPASAPSKDGKAEDKECVSGEDPEKLAKDPDIAKAIRAFGLEKENIYFAGCVGGIFKTEDVSPISSVHEYKISYPLYVEKMAEGNAERKMSSYVAPITHELAHVFQIRNAGSMRALKDQRKIIDIELSADFLSGLAFSETQNIKNINYYQQNLALVGLYNESLLDAHGTWSQRVAAFRYGVFLKDKHNTHQAESSFRSQFLEEILTLGRKPYAGTGTPDFFFSMDKLSACKEMTSLYTQLTSSPAPLLGHCRKPRNEIEYSYSETYRKYFGRTPCLLSVAPTPVLSDFSCFQASSGEGAVTCIRPGDPRAVENHFADVYIAREAAYLAQSSACGDNADSFVALPSLFPPSMALISKFEFGYSRSLGKDRPVVSGAQHGFATLDPALAISDTSVVEYLTMFVNAPRYAAPKGRIERIGPWQITVDEPTDFNRGYKNFVKKETGLDIYLQTSSMDMRADPRLANADEVSADNVKKTLNGVIAKNLGQEGFKKEKSPEMEKMLAKDSPFLTQSILYGFRQSAPKFEMDSSVFIKKNPPFCALNGEGAVGAVFGTISRKKPNSADEISLVFMVAGVGACAELSVKTIHYFSELRENIVDLVLTSLKE